MGTIKLEAGGWLALVPQIRLLFIICKATFGPLAYDDTGSVAWIDREESQVRGKNILISEAEL